MVSSLFLRSAPVVRLAVLSFLSLSRGVAAIKVLQQYELQATYSGATFFDNFNFITGDPNGDFVNYVDYTTAVDDGQIEASSDGVYLLPDTTTTLNPNGVGRASIKIVSRDSWTHGLVITDLSNMPGGVCGVAGRHYLAGATLANGEIDIITGINNAAYNQMTLFSQPTCSVAGNDQIGTTQSTACSASTGCSVLDDSEPNSYGDNFNNNGGGVFATEWTSSAIRIWFFESTTTPADIKAGTPEPVLWGEPIANFQGTCNIDGSFSQNSIYFDLDFCTTLVNANWAADGCNSLAATCREYVASFPSDLEHYSDFQGVYWGINSVKVYQIATGSPSSSSSSIASSTSSTSTSSALSSTSSAAATSTYSSSSSSYSSSSSIYSSGSTSSSINDPASSSTSSRVYSTMDPASLSSSSSSSITSSVSSSLTTDSSPSSLPASTTTSGSLTASSSYPYVMLPSTSSLPTFTTIPSSSSSLMTPTSSPMYTTSTVYQTSIYTVTSCAATVTDCPARIGSLTTETISLYTTICAVTVAETAAATPTANSVNGYYTTVVVTTYTSICPTGPTVITATTTITLSLRNTTPVTPPGALMTSTTTYTSPGSVVTLQLTTPEVKTIPSTVLVQPVVSTPAPGSTAGSIQYPVGNSSSLALGAQGTGVGSGVKTGTVTPYPSGQVSAGVVREWSLGAAVVAAALVGASLLV